MKNRIRFISHKQKKILLVDGTGLLGRAAGRIATLVPDRVTAEPRDRCCFWRISPGRISTRRAWSVSSLLWFSTGRI